MKSKSVQDVRAELLHRIRTEGVEAAYSASLAICKDEKAPAQARATAASSIFRIAGWNESTDPEDEAKELHEMTAAELAAAASKARRRLEALEASESEDDDPSVFA